MHNSLSTTWEDARRICMNFSGDLASINTAEENTFLTSMPGLLQNQKYWIGLNDIEKEGDFVWTDGSNVSFTAWQSGQPNNVGDHGQHCTASKSGRWGDFKCSQKSRFICRIKCK